MVIRKAEIKDAKGLFSLLETVQALHANGRPDIFKKGASKYDISHIEEIIKNPLTPVYTLVDEKDFPIGYAFCSIIEEKETDNLYAKKTFYIDDLCVRADLRGKGYGKMLYNYALDMAKGFDCDRLTLNVWHLNQSALRFYEKIGMSPLKTVMEQKIK